MHPWFLAIPNNALVSTDVSELLRSDSAYGYLLAIRLKLNVLFSNVQY